MGKPPSTPATGSAGKPPMTQGSRSVAQRTTSAGRMEKVIQGTHEVVRKQTPKAASMLGKAAGVLGRLAGPVGIGWALGEAVKDTSIARKAQGAVTNAAASLTGLTAKERTAMGSMSMKVSPRKTTTAPAPSTPSVPPKPVMQSTSTPTSSPAPKMAPKPSQKATGASKGTGKAMKGAELANFLGLSQNSAVRTYMETGKHKYPSGKK